MVLAMHAGLPSSSWARCAKNQVNALVKILVDFAVSTIAYFFVGYSVAYGVNFFSGAELLAAKNGYELVKFFFLLTFAAAIPAIVSGGIAERARFGPQLIATAVMVGRSTRSSRASPGTSRFGDAGLDQPPLRRRVPPTSPAAWWCMRWAAGSACRRCCCWARAATATAGRRDERASALQHPFPGAGRLDPSRWAGSAST